MPDYVISQGDTEPFFEDQLTYSNGTNANVEGATVEFVMRSLRATEPVKLTGTVKLVKPKEGKVLFEPSAVDSGTPGDYAAQWKVTFAGGEKQVFPTVGYLWVEVQPSLAAVGEQQLIGLPELKDHLNITPTDRTHDTKLTRLIKSSGALIENIVGPVRIKRYDEWYEGGHTMIALRHAPSYGYGSSPFLKILGCSEYRGPIEYSLMAAPTPTQGSVYSEMVHGELGAIVRRTAGGATYPFWRDPNHPQQSVHVLYSAGQETVPEGVEWALLETIKVAYESTMMVGRGFQTVSDQQEPQLPLGFAIPRHAMEYLEPLRRPPAFA